MNLEQAVNPYRCAVYFVPEVHGDWWQAGSRWLSRCAASGATYPPPVIAGVEASVFQACTSDPRRYGWHATLKAPFRLAAGQSLLTVQSALRDLAHRLPAFDMPPLRVNRMGSFLALVPQGDLSQIQATAAACVTELHPLAQALSEADLARRRKAPLTLEQDRLLLAWGYPWVLDEFRFHMSLTGPLNDLSPQAQDAVQAAAIAHFEGLPTCRFGHLALFVEPQAGADFELVDTMALSA
jgi:hypothetical protein